MDRIVEIDIYRGDDEEFVPADPSRDARRQMPVEMEEAGGPPGDEFDDFDESDFDDDFDDDFEEEVDGDDDEFGLDGDDLDDVEFDDEQLDEEELTEDFDEDEEPADGEIPDDAAPELDDEE